MPDGGFDPRRSADLPIDDFGTAEADWPNAIIDRCLFPEGTVRAADAETGAVVVFEPATTLDRDVPVWRQLRALLLRAGFRASACPRRLP